MAEDLADAIVHASEIMHKKESGKGIASIIIDVNRGSLLEGRCRVETEDGPAIGRTNLSYTAALNYVLRRGYVTRERDLEEVYNSLASSRKILVFSKKVPLIEDEGSGSVAPVQGHVTVLTGQEAETLVLDVILEEGDITDEGVTLDRIFQRVTGLVAPGTIRNIVDSLCIEGEIYSTVNEDTFKAAVP